MGYTCSTCGASSDDWSEIARCIDRHRNEPGGNRPA